MPRMIVTVVAKMLTEVEQEVKCYFYIFGHNF